MEGIALEYLGVSGWVIAVVLGFVVVIGFPTMIIRKMSKYKKEAVHGIYAKFHTATHKSYYIMCKSHGRVAKIEEVERKKLPVFATQKRRFSYIIDSDQCDNMLYPPGRPRFMQVMATTGEWIENEPNQCQIYTDHPLKETAGTIDAIINENFAQTLVGSVEKLGSDLRASNRMPSPTLLYILLAVVIAGIVAVIFIVRSQGGA